MPKPLNVITIEHKKYVLIPYADYRMMERGVPQLPTADAEGNRPAVATADAMIARGIVRDREAVGLNQKELAAAAGIRVENLNRIERGVHLPSMRTARKIQTALEKAGLKSRLRPR